MYVWYGMVWYGMVWYGMVWYGMAWHGMVWYGMVWYVYTYSHLKSCPVLTNLIPTLSSESEEKVSIHESTLVKWHEMAMNSISF